MMNLDEKLDNSEIKNAQEQIFLLPYSHQNYLRALNVASRRIKERTIKDGPGLRLALNSYGVTAMRKENDQLDTILTLLSQLKNKLTDLYRGLKSGTTQHFFSRESINEFDESIRKLDNLEKNFIEHYLAGHSSQDNDEKFIEFKEQCILILTEDNFNQIASTHEGHLIWRGIISILALLERVLNAIFVYLTLASPITTTKQSFFSTQAEVLNEEMLIELRL